METTSSAPISSPKRFGRYQLLDHLGSGGMADVYRAKLEGIRGFKKTVALKVFRQHLSMDPNFAPSFINEARLGGYLDHPNIIASLDFGECDGRLFLAMEFVRGPTLLQIIDYHRTARVPFPPDLALQIVKQMCQALEYAHLARDHAGKPLKMVHRDLKPSNILIDLLGTVKIADFGVARAESNLEHTLVPGTIKGTIRYMSPEQAWGQQDLDHRSDLFALGLILYELLTLRTFYDGKTQEAILRQAQDADLETRLPLVPDSPFKPDLVGLLSRALERDLEARFRNSREMIGAVDTILAGVPEKSVLREWVSEIYQRLPHRSGPDTFSGPQPAAAAPTRATPSWPPVSADASLLKTSIDRTSLEPITHDPDLSMPGGTEILVERTLGAQGETLVSRHPPEVLPFHAAEQTVGRPYFPVLGAETRVTEPWTLDRGDPRHGGPSDTASSGTTRLLPDGELDGVGVPAGPGRSTPQPGQSVYGGARRWQTRTVLLPALEPGASSRDALASGADQHVAPATHALSGARVHRTGKARVLRTFFLLVGLTTLLILAWQLWRPSEPLSIAESETGNVVDSGKDDDSTAGADVNAEDRGEGGGESALTGVAAGEASIPNGLATNEGTDTGGGALANGEQSPNSLVASSETGVGSDQPTSADLPIRISPDEIHRPLPIAVGTTAENGAYGVPAAVQTQGGTAPSANALGLPGLGGTHAMSVDPRTVQVVSNGEGNVAGVPAEPQGKSGDNRNAGAAQPGQEGQTEQKAARSSASEGGSESTSRVSSASEGGSESTSRVSSPSGGGSESTSRASSPSGGGSESTSQVKGSSGAAESTTQHTTSGGAASVSRSSQGSKNDPSDRGAARPSRSATAGNARLYLNAQPPCTFYLDGKRLTGFPIQDMPVTSGTHALVFVWEGGQRIDQEISLEEAESLRCMADLSSWKVRCRAF